MRPNKVMNELERWASFYLLMSGAAATLLGLMFVVSRQLQGSGVVMKIGYFGRQNSFALEMLRQLRVETPATSF